MTPVTDARVIPYHFDRSIPVVLAADVVVVGGGPGGIGAAVMAARAGAKTALIERYGFLGGMAASAEVHPFMPNHTKTACLDKPVFVEWARRIHALMPASFRAKLPACGEFFTHAELTINKHAASIAAEELCLEAGVQLLYHHTLVDVAMEGRRIRHAVLHSKSGFSAATASAWVDCTGDADLAALAGCEWEWGGPAGYCQPMTLCFKLAGVDRQRRPSPKALTQLYCEAKERGEIRCPRENVLACDYLHDDIIHFNLTRVIQKSGIDGRELSEAEIEARRQLREILTWLRAKVPGFENAELYSMGPHIGVRETRRIQGIRRIAREAFESRAKYPDAIARVHYPIDIHNPLGPGTEFTPVPVGDYYEIPYGCVVPKDVDNLTVGGRPISVDHAIHSSARVMPPACSVGQAAGLAAALAAQRDVRPADLDGCEVRARLVALGANLTQPEGDSL